ncbi:KICSTOR complex protein kaptin-like isoform X1 [Homalodisca vitripennis]|uniref:KICSTOR complex protein kaptin-like isoform X1 n=1 Tax=Homalodisca vitripennis TaxID=197043 RepID=UPI001EE9E888|nr:KICSTOR complex protein kaptin-like isoform X1 [Homalodisca vitripennis]
MNNFSEAHYFTLPTQGSVYSLAVLNLCSGINKFIIASLKKKIIIFEYSENSDGTLKPNVKEISCSYIPSGAEIIAVDAFNKSDTYDDFQIGLAIAKINTDGGQETYLNVYSEQDLDNNNKLNIDNIAQNCAMVELSFIPYHLTHTLIWRRLECSVYKEIAWLLSGSDNKIHLFVEDRQSHSYMETDITEQLPEFTVLPSVGLWIDIRYTHNFTRRVSVVGCDCGTLQMSLVNVETNSVIFNQFSILDGPITQVKLFSLAPKDIHPPSVLKSLEVEERDCNPDPLKNDLHLIVCSALVPTVVYMNIQEQGFVERQILSESDHYDVNLCACVADINFDGFHEILLGTFGKKILMYTWNGDKWKLSGQRNTANSVHSLHYVDVTNDGVNDLLIQTPSGVHILQHCPGRVHNVFLSRLKDDDAGREISVDIDIAEAFLVDNVSVEDSQECLLEIDEPPIPLQSGDAVDVIVGELSPETSIVNEPLLETIEVQKPLSDSDFDHKPLSDLEDCPCEEAFEQTEN